MSKMMVVWRKIFRRDFIFSLIGGGLVFIIALGVYLLAGAYWTPRQRPTGDEPHYLIIAQSLAQDHDLDLTNNYAQKDYRAWNYPIETLDPHVSVNSQNGKEYSFHNIGWPLLLVYPLKWWGVPGARGMAILIGALLALNIFLFVKKITKKASLAWIIFISTAFSIPFIVYSSQLFSEILAAFLICYAVRMLWERLPNTWSQASSMVAIAYLPWVHVKYIWVSLFLFLVWLYLNRKNKSIIIALIYIISGGVLSLLFKQWYGTYLPNGQYPTGTSFVETSQIGKGALGLLLDNHFGLLPYAPIYIFSLAGMIALFIREKFLGILLLGTLLAVFWQHASSTALLGWAPEGRFWVAVLPMLAVALGGAYPLLTTWSKIIFYLTGVWGLVTGYFLISQPALNYSTGKPVYLESISSKLINFSHFFPKIINMDQLPMITEWRIVYWWLGVIVLITLMILIFRTKKANF